MLHFWRAENFHKRYIQSIVTHQHWSEVIKHAGRKMRNITSNSQSTATWCFTKTTPSTNCSIVTRRNHKEKYVTIIMGVNRLWILLGHYHSPVYRLLVSACTSPFTRITLSTNGKAYSLSAEDVIGKWHLHVPNQTNASIDFKPHNPLPGLLGDW